VGGRAVAEVTEGGLERWSHSGKVQNHPQTGLMQSAPQATDPDLSALQGCNVKGLLCTAVKTPPYAGLDLLKADRAVHQELWMEIQRWVRGNRSGVSWDSVPTFLGGN